MADYIKRIRGEAESEKKDKRGTGYDYNYKPNKKDRAIRRQVWDRFTRMRDDTIRQEAEEDWEDADKKMRLWRPERDPDDWRADIRLPDAFASVQTYLQETVNLKIRPRLKPNQGHDSAKAHWSNSVLTYSMDRTAYDYETMKARNCAAARGTAFTVEEYLYETRDVQDLTGVNDDGSIKYEKREIVDKDDTFTRHWPNERVYIDEAADTIEVAEDCILEERLRYDTFLNKYGDHPDFYNTDKVVPANSVAERSQFFDRAEDMEGDTVQVLHYYNKFKDKYCVMANTCVIRETPIPFKHKELPVAVWNCYPVEGRIYGMGIVKIISATQEEREAIRNISLDRQKMHIHKMFLVNDLYDIDEDEATTRPHGFISVNTGGMPLSNAVQPIEYGDVPGSSIRMDDQLRDDEKRATGIDDRSQGVNMGGTATEAAILTEQSQKRINLINTLTAMNTIERIGKLKWSNIRFFYPAPKVEKTIEDDKEVEKKTYRKVTIDGKEFKVTKGPEGKQLKMNDITGSSTFELNGEAAGFMEQDEDIRIEWDIKMHMPQAIRQSKTLELFQSLAGMDEARENLNIRSSMQDVIHEFDHDPRRWMTDGGKTEMQQVEQANWENQLMAKGIKIDGTIGASQIHTMQHLQFTETTAYQEAVDKNPAVEEIFQNHIMQEDESMGGGAAEPDPMMGLEGGSGPDGQMRMPEPPPEVAAEMGGGPPASVGPVAQGGEVTNEMQQML